MLIKFNKKKLNLEKYYKAKKRLNYPCYCKSLIFISSNKKIKSLLISIDAIWASNFLSKNVRKKLSDLYSLKVKDIVLSATHTHGTPNPDKKIIMKPYSEDFEKHLINTILSCVKEGMKKVAISCNTSFKRSTSNELAINRRRKALKFKPFINYSMQNLPNFKKNKINFIDLIEFKEKKNNKLTFLIVKFSCHPVVASKDSIGADYPGLIQSYLNNYCKNTIFLQGFAGDIRPKLINNDTSWKDKTINFLIGKRFRLPYKEDLKIFSKKLAKIILKNNSQIAIDLNNEYFKSKEICILPTLETNIKADLDLNITFWKLDKVVLIFVNAEVLSGFDINEIENKKVICIGYSNGMIGYLPTSKDLHQGGYEVDKSRLKFNLPKRMKDSFVMDVQKQITYVLKNI